MNGCIALDIPIEKFVRILAFRIRIVELSISEFVRIRIYLDCECDGKTYSETKELTIKDDEYLNWGTDDNYLIELVKSKLPSLI